jgi:hypothetical protein
VLFTRSIRRKMVFLLGLVAVMLLASSIAGLASLRWYHNAIRELDVSVHELPRRGELDAAVGALFEPLRAKALPPAVQQREFAQRLEVLREKIAHFRRRIDALPPSEEAKAIQPVAFQVLGGVDVTLWEIEQAHPRLLEPGLEPDQYLARSLMLQGQVADLLLQVQRIPDGHQGLSKTIRNAVQGYDTRVRWIAGTSGIVLLLFVGLLRYGYCGIFGPRSAQARHD